MEQQEPKKKSLSVTIPRPTLPSLQATILILLIAVGVLQTAQLYGLSVRLSSGEVNAAPASVIAPSGSTDSVTSSLPSMVGGC